MSGKPSFFAELKRRNVYKVAVAYAIVGWLVVQIATQVFPFFEIPNWAVRLIVLAIVIGFPVALIFSRATSLVVSRTLLTPLTRYARCVTQYA
jgi:hypothetical protein